MTQQPSGSTPFVGPPPRPPREPEVHTASHVLHLLLSLITFGLWLPIWVIAAMNASGATAQDRRRYDDEMAAYIRDYDAWQRRHHEVYGVMPNPVIN